ncbi:MAG: cytochrome P450 [Thermocrispum agreste]|uniref:Cytochrome P450 n=1 Tax=Thermocrispum agreste TaxID=37925 RepID=A0ABD6FG06_9PSEU
MTSMLTSTVKSTVVRRFQTTVAAAAQRVPAPVRPLATPPPGSGLEPVLGDYGPPILGHSLTVTTDLLGFARERYRRYGPVQWAGGFGTRMVIVLGPEPIGRGLVNRDKAFANGPGWEYFIGPFFHRGVMLMDFDEHHRHRRIMQQAFTRDRLLGYLDVMNPAIARGLAQWQPRGRFPIYPALKRLTLDIATEVFVGGKLGPEADRLNEAFVDTVRGGQALIRADVPGGIWRRGLRARRQLERYFAERIPAKRAGGGSDLFSVLCRAETDDGQRFTDADVVNHMIFLLMAAHDTSTVTAAMMAYYLGKHPEWQERVRAESMALGTERIGYADLDRLRSLDLVLKESLRMSAPVGVLMRRAIADTELEGRYIPAGARVVLGVYPTQRMEPWWSNPDVFDPERFAEPRREDKSHRFAWMPFGGGAHKCIGMHFGTMEVKAIMHQLLLRYTWSVPEDYEPPMTYGTGPIPADGLPLRMRAI